MMYIHVCLCTHTLPSSHGNIANPWKAIKTIAVADCANLYKLSPPSFVKNDNIVDCNPGKNFFAKSAILSGLILLTSPINALKSILNASPSNDAKSGFNILDKLSNNAPNMYVNAGNRHPTTNAHKQPTNNNFFSSPNEQKYQNIYENFYTYNYACLYINCEYNKRNSMHTLYPTCICMHFKE